VLERLDAAGAVEVGRLAMVEFAMGPHGFNANYPLCRNPHDLDRIPCGSSSGSGAAVAARLVHGSLGSDTGGSIRCPAAVNGVTGLMPTNGRVSRSGVMPMSFSLDVVGPLARTARDCARLLTAIAGADPRDGTTMPVLVPDYEVALDADGPLPRIGVARGYFDRGLDPRVGRAFEEAVEEFRRAGFEVADVAMPVGLLDEVAELHPLVMKAEGAANHLDAMRARPEDYTPEVRQRLQAGFFIPATDYIRALKLRAAYLAAFSEAAFAHADLVLTPTIAIPTPTIAETSGKTGKAYLDMVVALTRNTKVVNYFGLPAMSVPCGLADGVPTAFQLVGRPFAEAALLRAADRYQRRTEWHRLVPAIGS
jgi:aspartyl-tRNA(Asn)/glutamyl-tRNA(Gln) amidotransferase subunit A